ncbi:MAG: metallophosphoesterase [Clostridium sp.]|nr:metallophosphoesterase [Clostridium sp.]
MTSEKTLIIPDVHGRSFWRTAVGQHPGIPTIFLGDYTDPYPFERISSRETIDGLRDIVDLARTNPNVTLLMGNHDLHYLCDFGEACRLDYDNFDEIRGVLRDNLDLFRIAELRETGGKRILYSHAPILDGWMKAVGMTGTPEEIVGQLNTMLSRIGTTPWTVESNLGQISKYRGGYDYYGSPVWADLREVTDFNTTPGVDLSVFGHTQLQTGPYVRPRYACLDCRRAFLLTPELTFEDV